MPYKDPAKQRAFALARWNKNRSVWFQANGPCKSCGTWEQLELDHMDPTTKVSHRIWSWSEKRRLAELTKCQVLCKGCHQAKTASRREGGAPGERNKHAKLTASKALSARDSDLNHHALASKLGVSESTIRDIRKRRTWKCLREQLTGR